MYSQTNPKKVHPHLAIVTVSVVLRPKEGLRFVRGVCSMASAQKALDFLPVFVCVSSRVCVCVSVCGRSELSVFVFSSSWIKGQTLCYMVQFMTHPPPIVCV